MTEKGVLFYTLNMYVLFESQKVIFYRSFSFDIFFRDITEGYTFIFIAYCTKRNIRPLFTTQLSTLFFIY